MHRFPETAVVSRRLLVYTLTDPSFTSPPSRVGVAPFTKPASTDLAGAVTSIATSPPLADMASSPTDAHSASEKEVAQLLLEHDEVLGNGNAASRGGGGHDRTVVFTARTDSAVFPLPPSPPPHTVDGGAEGLSFIGEPALPSSSAPLSSTSKALELSVKRADLATPAAAQSVGDSSSAVAQKGGFSVVATRSSVEYVPSGDAALAEGGPRKQGGDAENDATVWPTPAQLLSDTVVDYSRAAADFSEASEMWSRVILSASACTGGAGETSEYGENMPKTSGYEETSQDVSSRSDGAPNKAIQEDWSGEGRSSFSRASIATGYDSYSSVDSWGGVSQDSSRTSSQQGIIADVAEAIDPDSHRSATHGSDSHPKSETTGDSADPTSVVDPMDFIDSTVQKDPMDYAEPTDSVGPGQYPCVKQAPSLGVVSESGEVDSVDFTPISASGAFLPASEPEQEGQDSDDRDGSKNKFVPDTDLDIMRDPSEPLHPTLRLNGMLAIMTPVRTQTLERTPVPGTREKAGQQPKMDMVMKTKMTPPAMDGGLTDAMRDSRTTPATAGVSRSWMSDCSPDISSPPELLVSSDSTAVGDGDDDAFFYDAVGDSAVGDPVFAVDLDAVSEGVSGVLSGSTSDEDKKGPAGPDSVGVQSAVSDGDREGMVADGGEELETPEGWWARHRRRRAEKMEAKVREWSMSRPLCGMFGFLV